MGGGVGLGGMLKSALNKRFRGARRESLASELSTVSDRFSDTSSFATSTFGSSTFGAGGGGGGRGGGGDEDEDDVDAPPAVWRPP